MSDEDDNQDIEQNIQEASKKLNIDIDILRDISLDDVRYLLDRCPFLQILGPTMDLEAKKVKVVQSESGWDIHDYGDAISSSPGRLLFGGGSFRVFFGDEEDEGGSGGDIINPGKGTIRNQAVVTASDIVLMAKERGWKHFTVVDGDSRMKRAAWIKASEQGLRVDGFEPTAEDERVRKRVQQSEEELESLKASIKPDIK